MKGFFCLLLLLLVFSCTFSPHGVHEVEVQPTPAVQVASMNLLNAGDTLVIYGLTNLQYAIDSWGHKEIEVSARFANQELFSSRPASGDFQISPSAYPDGTYTLRLSAVTNSGTGSLADHAGAEKVIFEKTWTVLVDQAGPSPVKIIALRDSSGRLRMEWEKYKRPNFTHYSIKLSEVPDTSLGLSTRYTTDRYYLIKNRNQTVLVDSGFVGGTVTASISAYGLPIRGSSPSLATFSDDRSRITHFESLPGGNLKVTWNKTKYYASFDSYSVQPGTSMTTPYFTTTRPADTVGTVGPVGFGGSFKLFLQTKPVPHSRACCTEFQNTATWVYYGEKSVSYHAPIFTAADGLLYTLDHGKLSRWRAGQLEKSLALPVNPDHAPFFGRPGFSAALTPDGQRLFISSGYTIREVNPVDLSTISSFSTSGILGPDTNPASQLAAPEGNYIFFTQDRQSNFENSDYVLAYNIQTHVISDFHNAGRPIGKPVLNRKGDRLLYQRDDVWYLLRFENGQFVGDDAPYALEGSVARFNPLNEAEVYAFDENTLNIYDAVNLQFKQRVTLETPINAGIRVDQVTGYVGGYDTRLHGSPRFYYCLDPKTGRIRATVKLGAMYDPVTGNGVSPDLHNNFLYSPLGYKLKLDINP